MCLVEVRVWLLGRGLSMWLGDIPVDCRCLRLGVRDVVSMVGCSSLQR